MCWELVQDGEKAKCWLNLDEIEIYTEGTYKGCRNWKNSVGKKIGVRYKWCHDDMEEKWFIIIDYNMKKSMIFIKDKNDENYKITTGHIKDGRFGKMFNKFTIKFIYNINDKLNNLIIIDREYKKNANTGQNYKWYKYQCLKCGNIDWMVEGDLKKNQGCNVCGKISKKVIKGVNDIATTHPHLCKYFVNKEDVYKYTAHSSKKVLFQCSDCGYQKKMSIAHLVYRGFGCDVCSDGISYPEKFMANILNQLNIKFKTQLNKTTFDWCQIYKYDFYLTDYNVIIETHGLQHYENTGRTKYKNVHENDLLKYDIAVLNGFEANKNYFVIDCRKSTLEWMKKNIIETLGYIFDLSNIDWEKADLKSQKSYMALACQLKKENQNLSTTEIAKIIEEKINIKYTKVTIYNWLKKGNELGLCYYNGKEEQKKTRHKQTEETKHKRSKSMKGKNAGKNSPSAKKVKQIDPITKEVIKIWDYIKEISETLGYSYKSLQNHLSGKQKGKPYKGYIWECCE